MRHELKDLGGQIGYTNNNNVHCSERKMFDSGIDCEKTYEILKVCYSDDK